MDALQVYASDADSDSDSHACATSVGIDRNLMVTSNDFCRHDSSASSSGLPPPPEDLLAFSSFPRSNGKTCGGRIRSFPHVKGNYAVHVYIPVNIPTIARSKVIPLMKKAAEKIPDLQFMVDWSSPSSPFLSTGGAGTMEYHISLSRTVAIRVHQIDSIASMLRSKFSSQQRYVIEFGSWEAFSNDEKTRSFLSLEMVSAGVSEMSRQVYLVDEVFRFHGLPPFYKDPRPHISLAWMVGDKTSMIQSLCQVLNRLSGNVENRKPVLWSSQVRRIECKIGSKVFTIWTY